MGRTVFVFLCSFSTYQTPTVCQAWSQMLGLAYGRRQVSETVLTPDIQNVGSCALFKKKRVTFDPLLPLKALGQMPLGFWHLEIGTLLSHRSVQVLSPLGKWPVLKVTVGWVSMARMPLTGALISSHAQHLSPHSWWTFSARVPTGGSPRFLKETPARLRGSVFRTPCARTQDTFISFVARS